MSKSNSGGKAGERADYLDPDGYTYVDLEGEKVRADAIAVLFMTGEFPKGEVEHLNGILHDNSWVNLRVAESL